MMEAEQSTASWVRDLARLREGRGEMFRVAADHIEDKAQKAFGFKGPNAVAWARGLASWLRSEAGKLEVTDVKNEEKG